MRISRVLTSLAVLAAILAAVAAGVGLFWDGGTAPTSVTSIRGDTVQLFGHGLYR